MNQTYQSEADSFDNFVMTCARSMLNDSDLAQIGDGPIPFDFVLTENQSFTTELGKAKERLASLKQMKEQDVVQAVEHHNQERKVLSLHNAEMMACKVHQQALLSQLEGWTPPTQEHADFKHVMRTKLQARIGEYSMEFPVHKENANGKQCLKKTIEAQEMFVARLEAKVRSESNRVKMINTWLNDLRTSMSVKDETRLSA